MRRNNYHNKIPPFTPDPEHFTRMQRLWKAKVAYESEDDAWEFLNQNSRLKAKDPVVYRCSICNKFHISIHYKKNDKGRIS